MLWIFEAEVVSDLRNRITADQFVFGFFDDKPADVFPLFLRRSLHQIAERFDDMQGIIRHNTIRSEYRWTIVSRCCNNHPAISRNGPVYRCYPGDGS